MLREKETNRKLVKLWVIVIPTDLVDVLTSNCYTDCFGRYVKQFWNPSCLAVANCNSYSKRSEMIF